MNNETPQEPRLSAPYSDDHEVTITLTVGEAAALYSSAAAINELMPSLDTHIPSALQKLAEVATEYGRQLRREAGQPEIDPSQFAGQYTDEMLEQRLAAEAAASDWPEEIQ